MGIFSQDKTSTNQTSYNQQLGISTRDVTGAQLTSGGGSVTSFGGEGLSVGGGGSSAIYTQAGGVSIGGGGSSANVTVNNNLDATALDTAASLINNAVNANAATTQSLTSAFSSALSASSEHPPNALGTPAGPAPLSTAGADIASSGSLFSGTDTILIGAAALVGAFLLYGYLKHRR